MLTTAPEATGEMFDVLVVRAPLQRRLRCGLVHSDGWVDDAPSVRLCAPDAVRRGASVDVLWQRTRHGLHLGAAGRAALEDCGLGHCAPGDPPVSGHAEEPA
jgi:hypothetical protein